MQFSDVIKKRRAIRNYASKAVERTTIEKLIGSAILAPSAMNLQPWAFAAVVDCQKVDEYAKRAKGMALGVAKDVFRHRPKKKFPQTSSSMRADDDQLVSYPGPVPREIAVRCLYEENASTALSLSQHRLPGCR